MNTALKAGIHKLEDALAKADCSKSDAEVDILASMQALRTTADSLERRVSSARWPLPKYRDMLFLY